MRTVHQQLQNLRRYCLSLPDSSEVQSWGHPNFRVGRRTFCVFEYYKDVPSIVVKSDIGEIEFLLQDSRFYRTPYLGKHDWISLRIDRPVSWDLIQDLVIKSYRLVSGTRTTTDLDKPRRKHAEPRTRRRGGPAR